MSSDVASLLQRIVAEHTAAERGMSGIAAGVARHTFINAHMQRMWALKDELSAQTGESEAIAMMCRVMLDKQGGSNETQ